MHSCTLEGFQTGEYCCYRHIYITDTDNDSDNCDDDNYKLCIIKSVATLVQQCCSGSRPWGSPGPRGDAGGTGDRRRQRRVLW